MKILYVNGKNALNFDKEIKNRTVFAKYFSPTCPACIAMKDVWDETSKKIEKNYDTDIIMAQIDPDGIEALAKTDTHSDVSHVPSLIVLVNGKKTLEYEGERDTDKLIEFLLKQKLITRKNTQRGGKYVKQNTSSKKRASKKHASKKHASKKRASKKRASRKHVSKKHN